MQNICAVFNESDSRPCTKRVSIERNEIAEKEMSEKLPTQSLCPFSLLRTMETGKLSFGDSLSALLQRKVI